MSGDVQPRKRKDKKRKKDEFGVEEPRGTAAVLGEGDVFIHSHHDHGTGGHWCAKIIFFSLLAVLITLIGLIILENRGLTELEANSVESRYSGVLDGWLEDAPDDHHDEHTLELKHDEVIDQDDDHSQEIDQDDEDEYSEEDEHEAVNDHDDEVDHGEDDEDDEEDDEDNQEDDEDDQEDDDGEHGSEEQNIDKADDEDNIEQPAYRRYARSVEHQSKNDNDDAEDDENDDDLHKVDENDTEEDIDENNQEFDRDDPSPEKDDNNFQSLEGDDDDNEQSVEEGDGFLKQDADENYSDDVDDEIPDDINSKEDDENRNEDEQDEIDSHQYEDEGEKGDETEDAAVEIEKLENDISDEEPVSKEEPAQFDSEENDKTQVVSNEEIQDDGEDDEEEYLELDDEDEPPPVVEHIKVPAGKPLAEVEEDTSSEKPPDTLAEEEEYEKQQEELRRKEAEASHMWLKLVVGGALLVATHAVVRRATASRDTPATDEQFNREETPVVTRRMTLIPEEAAIPATSKDLLEEIVQPVIEEEEIKDTISLVAKSPIFVKHDGEEVDDDEDVEIDTKEVTNEPLKDTVDKELYSDEEDEDEDEEEEIVAETKETPKLSAVAPKDIQPEPKPDLELEDDVPDDVEIIDDEQLEEEIEEEEDDEDISDVDDAELLSRLEAKYGRLPEPERPGQKFKDGGNSIEDDWPGEPSDAYWRQQLDQAEEELRQGEWSSALRRVEVPELKGSARGKWLQARALDAAAESRRDNALLTRAIATYLDLLKMNERLADNILLQVTNRTLERIRFRGNYLSAEPVYKLLIRRFPAVPDYRNNLTISFLMANRADLAEEVIIETLKLWPDDRVALAHYGFILKTQHNRLEEAVDAFQKALENDVGPATEPRFYYHLGDALLLLGRYAEAHEVHKRGTALGHFLSPAQRSLYNVDRLKSQPWWNIELTPYLKLARALEKSWKEILKEGEAARALYEKEKEGLKDRGDWSQLDLFVRGQEIPNRCKKTPVTCGIVRSEPAAAGCRRGQVKFSSMAAGTHIRPHVGPTNCRLRMHLGLSNTKDTYIRVDQETRQWQAGKVFMFDDSFEHEVWHNGTGTRLVLIVDVWHPDLTRTERRSLPAI